MPTLTKKKNKRRKYFHKAIDISFQFRSIECYSTLSAKGIISRDKNLLK